MRTDPSIRLLPSSPDVGADERARLLDTAGSDGNASYGLHADAFGAELADHVGTDHALVVPADAGVVNGLYRPSGAPPADDQHVIRAEVAAVLTP